MVQAVQDDGHGGARLDAIAAQLVRALGGAGQADHRRQQADGLGDDRLRPRQPFHIRRGGRSRAEHRCHLLPQPLAGLGMLRQQLPHPAQSRCGGFHSGADEGHQLVVDLLNAVAVAGFRIGGVHEQGQQIVLAIDAAAAMVGDEPVHHPLGMAQIAHGPRFDDPARQPHDAHGQAGIDGIGPPAPSQHPGRDIVQRMAEIGHEPAPEESQQSLQHHLRHGPGDIGTEHGARGDIQCEPVHLGPHIDDLPLGSQPANALHGIVRGRHHDRREPVHIALGEDRLHQPPIALPLFLVEVGDQPPPERHREHVVLGTLHVVVLVGDQHLPHQLRTPHNDEARERHPRHQHVIGPRQPRRIIHHRVIPHPRKHLQRQPPRLPPPDARVVPPQRSRRPPGRMQRTRGIGHDLAPLLT